MPRAAPAACPWVDSTAPIPQRVSQLLAQMTVAQEVALATGSGGSSYVGFTPAIGSLCIPAMNLEDGPAGVADGMTDVTQLPAPVERRRHLGHRRRAAPTARSSARRRPPRAAPSTSGRPSTSSATRAGAGPSSRSARTRTSTAQLGAADIRGVQSTGVMAQVKHLAVYNQETNRNTPSDNAVISDRTLQEIYLPAFQRLRPAGRGLLGDVLLQHRQRHLRLPEPVPAQRPCCASSSASSGFVTSDWGATHSTAASANAGLDQDMPGNDGFYGTALTSAVTSGSVSQATLDTMATPRSSPRCSPSASSTRRPPAHRAQTATSAAHQNTATQLAEPRARCC